MIVIGRLLVPMSAWYCSVEAERCMPPQKTHMVLNLVKAGQGLNRGKNPKPIASVTFSL
jgi:hypothetical protein